jgi:hypothetical protein
MDIKRRLIVKITSIIFLLLLYISCCEKNKENYSDSFLNFEDYLIYDDCNIYKVIIEKGDYIFKFGLSGKCDSLTVNDYLNHYEVFYQSKDSLFSKRGKIRIEYYNEMKNADLLIEKIVLITKKITNRPVMINERWDEGFEIEVK